MAVTKNNATLKMDTVKIRATLKMSFAKNCATLKILFSKNCTLKNTEIYKKFDNKRKKGAVHILALARFFIY